jgi:hypothetical protein
MHKINLEITDIITNIVNTLITNDMQTPSNTLIAHLRNAETNHIGFSYNINTGDHNPDKGYMVSIKGYEETAPSGCDLIAFGRSYFLRHAEQLADPNYYMGCWVNAGRFVFDISENVQTKEIAIELGSINNQQIIWDCESGSEYRLMREGDEPAQRLEELREALRSESISYGEIAELQSLSEHIDKDDVELLEASGVAEFESEDFDAMLETLDVAMDELNQIYNHSASNDFREYYEMHMNQLDNIINLINKLK